eukprot:1158852-Pelagomonas_calceolata.AAC.2
MMQAVKHLPHKLLKTGYLWPKHCVLSSPEHTCKLQGHLDVLAHLDTARSSIDPILLQWCLVHRYVNSYI